MIEVLAQARLDELEGVDLLLLGIAGLALAELVVRRLVNADIEWVRVDGVDAEGVVLRGAFAEGFVVILVLVEPGDVAGFAFFGLDVIVVPRGVERVVGDPQVIIILLLKGLDGFRILGALRPFYPILNDLNIRLLIFLRKPLLLLRFAAFLDSFLVAELVQLHVLVKPIQPVHAEDDADVEHHQQHDHDNREHAFIAGCLGS